jgi:coenzyme F420-reducing hydrogenase delta subunit
MLGYETTVKCVTTARKRFVSNLRVVEVPCNGHVKYILIDFDDSEAYVFYSVSELLEFVRREKTDVESYVAECP